MFIERVIRKGRNTEIILDDSSSFFISSELFDQSNMLIEQELSEQEIAWLKNQNELRIVKIAALKLLSRRAHSRFELELKLKKKNFTFSTINKTLDELKSEGFLNDKQFAELYFSEKFEKKRKGINVIKNELFRKGIAKEIVEEVIANFSDSKLSKKNIEYLAEKKIRSLSYKKLNKSEINKKVIDHLLRKGFDYSDIKEVLDVNHF